MTTLFTRDEADCRIHHTELAIRIFSTMISFTWVLLLSGAASTCTDTLPKVDLGYEIHKAISFNVSFFLYNIDDIGPLNLL